jgi:hypothetical protein
MIGHGFAFRRDNRFSDPTIGFAGATLYQFTVL